MRKFFISLMLVLSLTFPSFAAESISYTVHQDKLDIWVQDRPGQPVTITIYDEGRKYYIDQGDTDSNGQIRFQVQLPDNQVYRSSVRTSGSIETEEIVIGNPSINPEIPEKQTATISIRGIQGSILNRKSVEIFEGDTVLDVLRRALRSENIDFIIDSYGYVKNINGESAGQYGPPSGWIYRVNGNYDQYRNLAAGDVEVKNGDFIEWRYSKDGGIDIGWETGLPLPILLDKKQEQILVEIEAILAEPDIPITEMEKVFDNILEQCKTDPDIVSVPEIKEKISQLAERIVQTAQTFNIPATEIQQKEEKPFVLLKKNNIITAANRFLKITQKIENGLKEIEIVKVFPRQLNVQIPLSEKQEITVGFASGTIKEIFEKELDSISLETELSSFKILPDTFDKAQQEKEIHFTVKKPILSKIPKAYQKHFAVDIQCLSENGNAIRFSEPIEVHIPYKENTDSPEKVGAFRLKEDQTLERVGGIYDETAHTVAFLTSHFSIYFAQESEKTFGDLESCPWAKKPIERMASKGIIHGRNSKCFDPQSFITRAEFAALITKMLPYEVEETKISPFEDIRPNDWYFQPVQTAYKKDLMKGVSNSRFHPNENITRQEMAVVLAKILEKRKKVQEVAPSILEKFEDHEQVAPWARESIALLIQKGILSGIGENILAPGAPATRAQTAVLLDKIYPLLFDS